MRLIDADEIKFEANEFDTYNDYITAFDAVDMAPTFDQWHYPSKGELPEKDVDCLVYTPSGNVFIAKIDGTENCWCTGKFFETILADDCVVAWQYIIIPENWCVL